MQLLKRILFLLVFQTSLAQGEANYWYFGGGAGLDFNSGVPVAVTNGQTNNIEGCATISNEVGELLFYTDGVTVWNKNHVIMQNGSALFGHNSSTQSATIVPKPGSINLYYIFTIDATAGSNGFSYSVVDIDAQGGLGAVVAKNVFVYGPTCEKLAVIKKSDDFNYWIVTHDWGTNLFKTFELTTSGLNATPVNTAVGPVYTGNVDVTRGTMKISSNGKKLAACSSGLGQLDLFDFNTTTGVLSNPILLLNEPGEMYGVEFSSNNKFLYVSNATQRKVYQFNLNAVSIPASIITVSTQPEQPSSLQMGPDGKIYVALFNSNFLSVINSPNVSGSGCNYQVNGVDLLGKLSFQGLPVFNQSFLFTSEIISENTCLGESTNFSVEANETVNSILWDFGDGTTANSITASHVYTVPGEYTITAIVSSNFGDSTITKKVFVSSPPTVTIPILKFCDNNDGTYTVDTTTLFSDIVGSQSDVNLTIYDANNQPLPNPLPNPLTVSNLSLIAEVNFINNPDCKNVFNLPNSIVALPNILLVSEDVVCDNNQKIKALVTNSSGLYTYKWFIDTIEVENEITNELAITKTGNYKVVVTNENGCSAESNKNILKSSIATIIKMESPQFASNSSIRVYVIGLGSYEYALDNIDGPYQDSNYFESVSASKHTVYVRDKNGCGIVSEEIAILSIPNFFTPNNDGFNDYWNIKGIIDTSETISIAIFDRFGKVLKKITTKEMGWDGTYNGKAVTATDYWYSFTLADSREVKGHFSLKR
ncbi:T9SS type B sorting domain-containing protein [Flavobacterium amnicola]|uniref:T9SS type B sorting domain-containing protein n=1 Tax=Flavobacterium amnicola TaxID=2506422 RepID=A0A4V1N2B8_9FLAO|nr:T9SS type B sorting domain-containing protein [Flavobacterium amnicola]RXR21171.1 T9SS type B sorting domain-containing protein [Flavobacterium amnicola]